MTAMLNTSTLPGNPSLRCCCHQLRDAQKFDSIRRAPQLIRCSARQPEVCKLECCLFLKYWKDCCHHRLTEQTLLQEAFRTRRPLALGFAALVAAGLTQFCPPAYAELEVRCTLLGLRLPTAAVISAAAAAGECSLAVIVQIPRTLRSEFWHALQTVPAASVTAVAKPIKEQKVDKEKVWLIFILGAAGLFGGTLLLENNERFFPAIYKANLAMSQAKKAMKVSGMTLSLLDR